LNSLFDHSVIGYSSVNQPKPVSRTIKTLDQLSADELYEYLLRLDPNLKSLAEKLKNERVSGIDLIHFHDNDYENFDITYGEKKKLQLLIERKQSTISNVSDLTQIQNEITQLKSVLKKQEEEIEEKTNSIQQLDDIVKKQEQQTQLQDAIIKQLQEAIEKQKQEMKMLMELVEQQRILIASSQKL
jgi:methyl-accepting chemotaxis protein